MTPTPSRPPIQSRPAGPFRPLRSEEGRRLSRRCLSMLATELWSQIARHPRTSVSFDRQSRSSGCSRRGWRRQHVEHGRSPNLTPADGNWGAAVGPSVSGFPAIIGGLEAKGFFARKLVSIIPSVPVIHGSVSCPVHVPSANHTSSYGWIYARSRLRLDRLCRNGGRSGFFP